MSVCCLCGRSSRTTEQINVGKAGGISFAGKELKWQDFVCIDDFDCEATIESRKSDYPEDEPEETPYLDPPWWKNP